MQIPSNAKKVFDGIRFNVYHWEQEMYDGSSATFEMLERQGSVEVIATVGDKIIMLDQEQPGRSVYPSLPGGVIDPGEVHEDAVRRELMEETGHESDDWELAYHFDGTSKLYFPEYIYIARNCRDGHEQMLDAGEKITVKLVTFDEFLQSVRHPLLAVAWGLKLEMLEALLDEHKYHELKKKIFG